MSDKFLEPAAEYVAAVTFTFRLPGCYYSARSASEYAAVLVAEGVTTAGPDGPDEVRAWLQTRQATK
jgi:hypothetical protein